MFTILFWLMAGILVFTPVVVWEILLGVIGLGAPIIGIVFLILSIRGK